MALDLITFRNSIKNLIHKHNTNTSSYDLSDGLNEDITEVIAGYSNQPRPNILFPVVYVELKNKSEAFASIGNNAKRDQTINFDIVAVTDFGLGQYDGRNESDNEMIKLSSNIEKMLRNHVQLSNTSQVMSSLINSVEYDVVEYQDTYNSIARISLSVEVFSA